MMSLKKLLGLVVAGAALMTVSGCSGPSPSVAARVGDATISVATVDKAAIGVGEIMSQDPQYTEFDTTGFVLQYWILGEKLTAALGQAGVVITDEEREALWNTGYQVGNPLYSLWTDPRTRVALRGFIDLSIAISMMENGQIDSAGLAGAVKEIPVEVNPRYGVWDESNQYVNEWTVSSRTTGLPATPLAEPTSLLEE